MTTGFTSKRHYKNDLKLLCQWCDERFTTTAFRLFCTHECKVAYYASLDIHLWTNEEEQYIIDLIGLYPMREIVRKFKRWSTIKIPDSHIKQKVESVAKREEMKLGDRVDNHSVGAWARLLGNINEVRIHRWIAKGLASRRSGKEHMISHKNMVAFAKGHLSYFQSIERQFLEWLFADELQWVDLTLKAKPAKAPVRSVLCVTTNTTYLSLTKTETDTGISRNRISTAIKSGIPTQDGSGRYLTFKYAD
jgi:hypothetical protein